MELYQFVKFIGETEVFYTRDNLQKGWFYYAVHFFNSRPNQKWEDLYASDVIKYINLKKNQNRTELAFVGFSLMRNKTVFLDFLSTLPRNFPPLFTKLVRQKALTRKEVEAITNLDLLSPPKSRYESPELIKEYLFFCTNLGSYYFYVGTPFSSVEFKIYLPLPVRKILIEYFTKPEGYDIISVPAPEGSGLKFFSSEESIATDFPSLLSYYVQDQIKFSEKGKPNTAGIKKLQRTLMLKEFFPESEFPTIRSLFMAGLIFGFRITGDSLPVHEYLKSFFKPQFIRYPIAPYLFTRLKGFSYFSNNQFELGPQYLISTIFSQLIEGQWVTLKNLHDYIETHFIELLPLSESWIKTKIYYEDLENEENDFKHKTYLSDTDFTNFITRPFLAGSAYLFGSFGLLELCYKAIPPIGEFGKDWFSEYDGLVAVRLTSLGAYVLGLKNDYLPPANNSNNRLVPDPNSLMIRVEGNSDLASVQLASCAQKISENRYQFSPAIFLKDCKYAKDIQTKVALFRQTIGTKLPEFWENYFKKLTSGSKLISRETDLIVFRIPQDDKELHRLLVHDEVLKKIVIKAEQYYILINKTNETVFRNRLKETGILLQ